MELGLSKYPAGNSPRVWRRDTEGGWRRPQIRKSQASEILKRKRERRDRQLLAMFILFNTLTVRDGIDVGAAHRAFLGIDEYRETISPDAPGAAP